MVGSSCLPACCVNYYLLYHLSYLICFCLHVSYEKMWLVKSWYYEGDPNTCKKNLCLLTLMKSNRKESQDTLKRRVMVISIAYDLLICLYPFWISLSTFPMWRWLINNVVLYWVHPQLPRLFKNSTKKSNNFF